MPEEYIDRQSPYRSDFASPTVNLFANPLDGLPCTVGVDAAAPLYPYGLRNNIVVNPTHNLLRLADPKVLLHGDTGALYFWNESYEAFRAISKRLINRQAQEPGHGLVFYVDELLKQADPANAKETGRIDDDTGEQVYDTKVKPRFCNPDFEFRIRFEGSAKRPFKHESYGGDSLKLTRRGIGHAWVDAGWIDAEVGNPRHAENSKELIEGIRFLFPETSSDAKFTLSVPGNGHHDVWFANGDEAAKPRLQAILYAVTQRNKEKSDPVEVIIWDAAHPPINITRVINIPFSHICKC